MLLCVHSVASQEAGTLKPVMRSPNLVSGGVNAVTIDTLPDGKLKTGLLALPEAGRHRALKWLRSFSFPEQDAVESLSVDKGGGIFYICRFDGSATMEPAPHSLGNTPHKDPVPTAAPPVYHSNPGAAYTIFLDFNGSVVTETAWNDTYSTFEAKPFDKDGDDTSFSSAEQDDILHIWQRVAEDYAPFDVNVTTEQPAGSPDSWNSYTGHVLITQNYDQNGYLCPHADAAGGVAYVNVFGIAIYSYYRPAWIYYQNLSEQEDLTADAASHEMGHNLALSHDGTLSGDEYYTGHGTGLISWGPIMGTGYNRNVSQWTKGEYYDANNTEDDCGIIAGFLTYKPDDHADSIWDASPLAVEEGTTINASHPMNRGVIQRAADADVFVFDTGAGTITLTIDPWISPANTRGGNLDIQARLYDSGGTVIAEDNPAEDTSAMISKPVSEGTYYLTITGSGAGDPLNSPPTGYTEYGSIGQFFISGTIVPRPVADSSSPTAYLSSADILSAGGATHEYAVIYKDNEGIDISTVDSLDVRVTGPNGYNQPALLVSVDSATDGTLRTAVYRISAPGGTWDRVNDLGTYNVWIEPDQVTDINGLAVDQKWAGDFFCNIPQLHHDAMDTDPGYSLQGAWWAYGTPVGTAGDPTDRNVIGYNNTADIDGGCYPNNMGSTEWAVTPAIDCTGWSSVDLYFKYFIGAQKDDWVFIEISNDGTSWTPLLQGDNIVTPVWTLAGVDVSAYAAGQPTVYVRFGMGPTSRARNDFGFNIDEVMLEGSLHWDKTRPEASANTHDITTGGGTAYEFTVTVTDDAAVDISGLDSTDIRVCSCNGYEQDAEFISVSPAGNGTPRTAVYRIRAGGLAWGPEDNGEYHVLLRPGQVSDTSANYALGSVIGTFLVDIADSNQPVLAWTGETEFVSDGVDPESGDSKTEFEFRVEYTDLNNDAPAWMRLYLDKNGDGDYADADEIVDMAVDTSASDPAKYDGDYTNGEWYTASAAIPCGADTDRCSYFFHTHNGTYSRETAVADNPDVLLNIGEGPGNSLFGEGSPGETVYYSFTVGKGGKGRAVVSLSAEHVWSEYNSGEEPSGLLDEWSDAVFYNDIENNGVFDSGTDTLISDSQIILEQGETANIIAEIAVPDPSFADYEYSVQTVFTASYNPSSSVAANTWVMGPLAVRLADLKAVRTDGGVLVSWVTLFEADNTGFNVYFRQPDREYVRANSYLIPSQYTGFTGVRYSFAVDGLDPETEYLFMVEDVDVFGVQTRHGPVGISAGDEGRDPDDDSGGDGGDTDGQDSGPDIARMEYKTPGGGCTHSGNDFGGVICILTALLHLCIRIRNEAGRRIS